jgi:hypothetical protein
MTWTYLKAGGLPGTSGRIPAFLNEPAISNWCRSWRISTRRFGINATSISADDFDTRVLLELRCNDTGRTFCQKIDHSVLLQMT